MKKIAGVLMVVLLIFSCNVNRNESIHSIKSDLEHENLKGKVAKIQKVYHQVNSSTCPAAGCADINKIMSFYNEDGNLIETIGFNENGDTAVVSRFKYDRQSKCIGIDKYSKNSTAGKEKNIYEGNLIKEVKVYNEFNELVTTCQYEYSGNYISSGKICDNHGDIMSSFNNFFLNGQLDSLVERDNNGQPVTISKYYRNQDQDVIASILLYPKSQEAFKLIYEYEYDSVGNWIKQTQKIDGDIVQIVIRNIEYVNN